MKLIVFLNQITDYEKFLVSKDKFKASSIVIIAISLETQLFLKKQKIQFKTPEEFITEKDAIELDEYAYKLGYNWHRDKFNFYNISLGRLLAWNSIYYFSSILRDFQTVIKIIEKENPSEILIFQNNNKQITQLIDTIRFVSSIKKLTVRIISRKHKYNHLNKKKGESFNYYRLISILSSIELIKSIFKCINFILNLFRIISSPNKFNTFKKILIYNTYREENLIEKLSKNNMILILNEHLNLRKIFENIKNLFLKKKTRFHIFSEDYYFKRIKKITKFYYNAKVDEWKKIVADSTFRNFFFFKDYYFWPLIKKEILKMIFFDFKSVIKRILIFLNIIKKEKFNLLVINDDSTHFTKTFVAISSKFKIPSLVIQHGFISRFYDIGFLPLSADKIAVWGKISRDNLLRYGVSDDKIVITGAPRFDYYIKLNKNKSKKNEIKKSIYAQYEIDKNKKLILFAPSHVFYHERLSNFHLNQTEILKIYEIVLGAIKDLPNCYLIIKLHPGDKKKHIPEEIIRTLGMNNVSVVTDFNIAKFIVSCDCLITSWSTTGTEAMILEKPIISIKLRKQKYHVKYIDYGAAIEVSNINDLKSNLLSIFKNPHSLKQKQDTYLKDDIHKFDGLSVLRVSKLIDEMIPNNKRS